MQETTPTETETATADPKRRYLCRHVFTEGHRCGSPALRGQSLCYNHGRSRREAPISGRSGTFPMPRIDDRASIQLALYEVLSRLSGGDIDYKRGGILLYGLQIASSNLPRHAQLNAEQQPQVEEVTADYNLGDLAPIVEIPNPEPAPNLVSAPHPLVPSPNTVILTLNEVKGKNPRIQPAAPQSSSQRTTNNGQRRTTNVHPVLPLQPLTLAAIHATANPQPATDNLQRGLTARTSLGSLTRSHVRNALQ
jgi:hypothetical protein